MRLDDPTEGLLLPYRFIDVAEESGLITEVDRAVLAEAVRIVAHHPRLQDPAVRVAVNLSSRTLAQPDLAEHLAGLLAEHGVSGSRLLLEVTETGLLADDPGLHRVLRDLTDLGAQLAIDDFGTGYSALAYLTRFRMHKLKIDRAFVRELDDPEGVAAATVRAIIQLAHAHGMRGDRRGRRDRAAGRAAGRDGLRQRPGVAVRASRRRLGLTRAAGGSTDLPDEAGRHAGSQGGPSGSHRPDPVTGRRPPAHDVGVGEAAMDVSGAQVEGAAGRVLRLADVVRLGEAQAAVRRAGWTDLLQVTAEQAAALVGAAGSVVTSVLDDGAQRRARRLRARGGDGRGAAAGAGRGDRRARGGEHRTTAAGAPTARWRCRCSATTPRWRCCWCCPRRVAASTSSTSSWCSRSAGSPPTGCRWARARPTRRCCGPRCSGSLDEGVMITRGPEQRVTMVSPLLAATLAVSPDQMDGRPVSLRGWSWLDEDGSLRPAEEMPTWQAYRTGSR